MLLTAILSLYFFLFSFFFFTFSIYKIAGGEVLGVSILDCVLFSAVILLTQISLGPSAYQVGQVLLFKMFSSKASSHPELFSDAGRPNFLGNCASVKPNQLTVPLLQKATTCSPSFCYSLHSFNYKLSGHFFCTILINFARFILFWVLLLLYFFFFFLCYIKLAVRKLDIA